MQNRKIPRPWLIAGLATLTLFSISSLLADEPKPTLVIDSGGHTSAIWEVLYTSDGRHLVSAGGDKVVRVWDIATGRTVRTIRGEIGPGDTSKIYAAALSPDGRTLAVGGWLAGSADAWHSVRLHDFRTGELLALLEGHSNVVLDLAFSPDGRTLASASNDRTVRLWDVTSWDTRQILRGHTDGIVAVAFSPDGRRLASGSFDHTLRLWDPATGAEVAVLEGHEGPVRAIVFLPGGQTLVSGSHDKTVRRWNVQSGASLGVLVRQGREVFDLALAPDGRRLVTGAGSGTGRVRSHIFSLPTGSNLAHYDHSNGVSAVAFAPTGDLVATAGGDEYPITLWNPVDGSNVRTLLGEGRPVWSVAWSQDGRSIAFGGRKDFKNLAEYGPLERTFRLRRSGASGSFELALVDDLDPATTYERARTQGGERRLETPSGSIDPELRLVDAGGNTLHTWIRDSTSGIDHCSFTFDRSGRRVVSGGGNGLDVYDASTGQRLHKLVGHTGAVWAVSVSPDDRLLVSGSADQTFRFWNLDEGTPLVTVFVGTDGEWVAWTEDGYYTASPAGDRYIGWHVNRGVDQAADYYPVHQFRQQYYRPDVVHATLELRDPELALAEANRRRQLGNTTTTVAGPPELPPRVVFVAPRETGTTVTRGMLPVDVLAVSQGSAVTDFTVSLNGAVINRLRGVARSDPGVRRFHGEVALRPGENTLTAIATTERSQNSAALTVTYQPAVGTATENRRPRLAVLAVGVADYHQAGLGLTYADDDARDLADLYRSQEGKAFSRVAVKVLEGVEDKPTITRGALLEALGWLQREAPSAGDVRLLFLAGHGITDSRGDYYFLAQDHRADADPETYDLSWLTLLRRLTDGEATAVLMVDTCRAAGAGGTAGQDAGANFTRVLKEVNADATNLVTFAAATGRQESVERSSWRNGAFTEALLRGLGQGQADGRGGADDGVIEVKELCAYVTDWVRREVPGQTPTCQVSPGLDILPLFQTSGGNP